jgi:hypothetical protein
MPRSAGLVDTVFARCGLQESEKRPLPFIRIATLPVGKANAFKQLR